MFHYKQFITVDLSVYHTSCSTILDAFKMNDVSGVESMLKFRRFQVKLLLIRIGLGNEPICYIQPTTWSVGLAIFRSPVPNYTISFLRFDH